MAWVRWRPAPALAPPASPRGAFRAPCRYAKTSSWLGLRKLFQCLEEVERPPGHAGIDASAAGHFDRVMENPTCDLSRTVDCDMESKYAPKDAPGDLRVSRNNISFYVAAGCHDDSIRTYCAEHASVNLKFAVGVKCARDRNAPPQPGHGAAAVAAATVGTNKRTFRHGGHGSPTLLPWNSHPLR